MSDILTRDLVVASGRATTRDEAIREAGELLASSGAVTAQYLDAMAERERTVSTYMGNYLAIPHGTNAAKDAIVRSALCLVRYDEPIDWAGNPVRVVVGIAGVNDEHLGILGKIAVIFADEDEVRRVLDASTADELYDIVQRVNT
ncbi:PTS sugar transporter subunit IIA [Cellulomonas sp. Root137]|uniref:PTS sugar transporter subunit IIA n=1 Tax=Cellulomonas sp. Root137 TaxID=1736459 RepID=UPI0006F716AF|nr:PTS sugar transporter subunit IIA [Cellulomonas sp. Root137]KQY47303.1 PTS mannitol transporter subunit IIA [Cellulomonas sp. Root137]KRD44443.1 PTS mannitol transporter subunit IIA [Cellulomonas sp. Root930]